MTAPTTIAECKRRSGLLTTINTRCHSICIHGVIEKLQNLIVIDALKYRYNLGRRSNLYFWRDAEGNEVDLLIENGPDVTPVEIKAGATISSDYFKGLRIFSTTLPSPPRSSALVYGGADRQKRSDVTILTASDVSETVFTQSSALVTQSYFFNSALITPSYFLPQHILRAAQRSSLAERAWCGHCV